MENLGDLNASGLAFVRVDIDLAMTFMDVAATSHIQETIRRNHSNARTAYDTVVRLLKKLTPNARQGQEIEAQLAVVKARLQAVGQEF